MRNANKSIIMLIILMLGFQLTFASANTLYPQNIPYQPPEQSREE